jgi:hypothetical protein
MLVGTDQKRNTATAEEVLSRFVDHLFTRTFLNHPLTDLLNSCAFIAGLREAGLTLLVSDSLSN